MQSHAHVNGVVQCQPSKSPTIYHRNVRIATRKTHARCPCTPQSTVETFGEEISAEACSGKDDLPGCTAVEKNDRSMSVHTSMTDG